MEPKKTYEEYAAELLEKLERSASGQDSDEDFAKISMEGAAELALRFMTPLTDHINQTVDAGEGATVVALALYSFAAAQIARMTDVINRKAVGESFAEETALAAKLSTRIMRSDVFVWKSRDRKERIT